MSDILHFFTVLFFVLLDGSNSVHTCMIVPVYVQTHDSVAFYLIDFYLLLWYIMYTINYIAEL